MLESQPRSHVAIALPSRLVKAKLVPILYIKQFVSEVDLMSVIYPLSFHRRIEGQWAERIKSLRRIHSPIVVATELALQRAFNNAGFADFSPGQNGRGPATKQSASIK